MTLGQLLGRQRRAEIRVMLPHQRDGMITHDVRQAIVRWPATPPVGNRSRTAIAVALQQPVGLPLVTRIRSAAAAAVSRPPSSRARTSIRLSSRLLISTTPIGSPASKPRKEVED